MSTVFYTKKFILMYSETNHQEVLTTMIASDLMEVRAHPANPTTYTAVRHRGWGTWVIIADHVDNVRKELYEITKTPVPAPAGGSDIPPLPEGFSPLNTPQDELEAYTKMNEESDGPSHYPALLMGEDSIPDLPESLKSK